jgi:curved DNA-binding protein CbpA
MASRQQGNTDVFYTRLEVLPGASHDEIARAYRRLAHDAHPDAHPGDPDASRRFREITEAYEVLGHPEKRDRYDRVRLHARSNATHPFPAPDTSWAVPGRRQVCGLATASGPVVFLGTQALTRPSAQLLAGPVQIGCSSLGPPRPTTQEDVAAALLARLLYEMFEPRWRY